MRGLPAFGQQSVSSYLINIIFLVSVLEVVFKRQKYIPEATDLPFESLPCQLT
jgi:hypothetical protein